MRGLIFITLVMCLGCTPEEAVTESAGYFDLEEYVASLSEAEMTRKDVTKTVVLNGESETERITDYDISPELQMMNKYNINKPALAGKYNEKTEGNLTIYEAVDKGLITRTLTIENKGNEVSRVEIHGLQNSILSDSKQTIIFAPSKSFLLKAEDKNRFTEDITKEILIEY